MPIQSHLANHGFVVTFGALILTDMKKLIVTVALMLSLTFAAHAQYSQLLRQHNRSISAGVLAGSIMGKEPYPGGLAFGVSASIFGVYFDYTMKPLTEGGITSNLGWDASKAWACHIGYQIPVTQKIRVIPVAGLSETQVGYKDGHLDEYGQDSRGQGFEPRDTNQQIDFGAVAQYLITPSVIAQVQATNHSIHAGVAFQFAFRR